MKVLCITGSFPPSKCGVGDYTYHLVKALAGRPCIEISVLTSCTKLTPLDDIFGVKIYRTVKNWRLLDVKEFYKILRTITMLTPDVVHIQYPTQGYNGRIAKYLPIILRLMGVPVVQTWHEHFSECGSIGLPNLVACNALIYVRPDLFEKLPTWATNFLRNIPVKYIQNASTIPVASLSVEESFRIKNELSGGTPIVCYFGFAYPNKGIERIFSIADPSNHHLVLISDLDENNTYQRKILKITRESPWSGKVTITGFQSAQRVGEILAVSDAAVFPFPTGTGEWNTSIKAAEAAGIFIIATTKNKNLLGYNIEKNTYYAECNQISLMHRSLQSHLSNRKSPSILNEWDNIAQSHENIYRMVIE